MQCSKRQSPFSDLLESVLGGWIWGRAIYGLGQLHPPGAAARACLSHAVLRLSTSQCPHLGLPSTPDFSSWKKLWRKKPLLSAGQLCSQLLRIEGQEPAPRHPTMLPRGTLWCEHFIRESLFQDVHRKVKGTQRRKPIKNDKEYKSRWCCFNAGPFACLLFKVISPAQMQQPLS